MAETTPLSLDKARLPELLQAACDAAVEFLGRVDDRPVNRPLPAGTPMSLPAHGVGAQAALAVLTQAFSKGITASPGPRYFGFVTGGSTPAALMGDWLTAPMTRTPATGRAARPRRSKSARWRCCAASWACPGPFAGRFVTGATTSNFVGLAIARQWWGRRCGADIAADGLARLPRRPSSAAHPTRASTRAFAMLGLGRSSLQPVATLPDREAVDVAALREALRQQAGRPCIVVANAGVVNTVDFDDLAAIAALKQGFDFCLHVDAAFGGLRRARRATSTSLRAGKRRIRSRWMPTSG